MWHASRRGEIFRQVAAITPVEVGANALVRPADLSARQLALAARRRGVPMRARERPEVVAELEAQIPAMLHRLKPAALRAAAAPLGVAARPIKTRADKAALVELLATALRAPEPPPPPVSRAALEAMTVRELQEEADRRGLDRRLCIERGDLRNLIVAGGGAEEEAFNSSGGEAAETPGQSSRNDSTSEGEDGCVEVGVRGEEQKLFEDVRWESVRADAPERVSDNACGSRDRS